MPVLESTDGGTPRSALRYRSLNETNKRSIVTTAAHPIVQRASRQHSRPADDDLISEWKRGDLEEEEEEFEHNTEPPVRRVGNGVKQSAGVMPPVDSHPYAHSRSNIHPLLFLGLGMLGMLAVWTALTAGAGWWNDTMDSIHYGFPRTFQVDTVVGHNDSTSHPSHFIALNLHGRIQIVEFPGGDGAHVRIYLGPQLYGTDADKAPVTLKFIDVNGDGRPDLLAFFQSSWIVFINNQITFRSPTVEEQQDATRYLAAHKQP